MGGFPRRSTWIGQNELDSDTAAATADFATAAKCSSATDYGYAIEPGDGFYMVRPSAEFLSYCALRYVHTYPDEQYSLHAGTPLLVIHALSGFVIYDRSDPMYRCLEGLRIVHISLLSTVSCSCTLSPDTLVFIPPQT